MGIIFGPLQMVELKEQCKHYYFTGCEICNQPAVMFKHQWLSLVEHDIEWFLYYNTLSLLTICTVKCHTVPLKFTGTKLPDWTGLLY